MCTPEILKLAELVKENEEDIMNGGSKLMLSADLLSQLNNCFCLVTDQTDIINSSFHKADAKNKDFTHLQYLYNFVQKTISLKLTPTNEKQENSDITQFKNLKFLEIKKLNIKSIVGIQKLRNKLNYLTCFRSLENLSDVLEKCGGDNSDGGSWSELKQATFSHNSLKHIDSSLEFAQNLSTLNLSNNEISEVTSLNCLVNLKHLNLGYNKLVHAPSFSGHICNRLRVLILRNNFLEEISDVSNLGNLNELDLRENCLIEHNCLIPLAQLPALQCINLSGNPLSYHPQHRNKSSSCLHISTVGVVLDSVILNKSEQKLVGSLHPRVTHSPPPQENSLEISIQKRPRKVRDADIQNVDKPTVYEVPPSLSSSYSQTKKQIKQLNDQYETKWLKNQTGSLGQDTLATDGNPFHSTPCGSADKTIMNELEHHNELLMAEECTKVQVTVEVYVTSADMSEQEMNNVIDLNEVVEMTEVDELFVSEDDVVEGEESVYVATVKEETDPVILVLTKNHIYEKTYDNVKVNMSWDIVTLISSDLTSTKGEVHIKFDTFKTNKKQRTYILHEKEEAQRLHEALQDIIKNKLVVDKFISMSCMKCNHRFKVRKNFNIDKQECPACNTKLCIIDNQ